MASIHDCNARQQGAAPLLPHVSQETASYDVSDTYDVSDVSDVWDYLPRLPHARLRDRERARIQRERR